MQDALSQTAPASEAETLLTAAEVMARWKITRNTLRRWVAIGFAPRPLVIGPRLRRFRLDEIRAAEMHGNIVVAQEFDQVKPLAVACWSAEDQREGDPPRADDLGDEDGLGLG